MKIISKIARRSAEIWLFASGLAAGIALTLGYFEVPKLLGSKYENLPAEASVPISIKGAEAVTENQVAHLETPEQVRAVYMSSWSAGSPKFRDQILKNIEGTKVNALVIDIKDYTGKISFEVSNPYLQDVGSAETRIADLTDFISDLHNRNLYVIGRISVFQDPYLIKIRPDMAVKKASDRGKLWADRKGIGWLDAGAEEVWEYTVLIAEEAYQLGFDEINFDYIRFPSDGNMSDIFFPFSNGRVKSEVIEDFFSYLYQRLKGSGAVLSADLFGMTTTNINDLNIGQVLELAAPYFDYISPMVYPSHFPKGWNGHQSPAKEPYKVVKYSLEQGAKRLRAMGEDPEKLRPWLQDFNLGAQYTPEMVIAQMRAVYDVGLDSWLLWDPSNTYTREALNYEPDVQGI